MKASRMSVAVAGALLAAGVGMFSPAGAMAGVSAPRGAGLSFHAVAPGRVSRLRAPFHPAAVFDHHGASRRRERDDFGPFDGAGVFLDEPPQEALGATPVQVAAYFTPGAPMTGAPGWAPPHPAGPKIIEIGRHAPRHVHWPVVVYGDR